MSAWLQRKHVPEPELDEAPQRGRMGFLDHLEELRMRIIRSLIAIAVGMLVAFFFYDRLSDFVLGPTIRALPPGTPLIYMRPGEGLSFYMDIALIGGLILAAPYVMYQVWRFIAPGLYAREKKFVIPFVMLTTAGTFSGALFTHYVMFPTTITFLGAIGSRSMKFMPRVEDTFDLYKSMMIGMVLVFQMPTIVYFLARLRLVTARFLWRNIKYAILIIFILAAVLTTSPDAWNQTVFAAPMVALYLLSIVIAWAVRPRGAAEPVDDSGKLRLVLAATMVNEAARARRRLPSRTSGEFPRLWRG
jgi:sec-independent protein translocase protein TatC